MKEKIRALFKEYYNDETMPVVELEDKVLDLFDVSTRTFKVGDMVQWRGMDLIVVELGINEILIATSQNVDDEGYNDWWVGTQYVC